MLFLGLENVRDFRTAWNLRCDRIHGRHVPVLSGQLAARPHHPQRPTGTQAGRQFVAQCASTLNGQRSIDGTASWLMRMVSSSGKSTDRRRAICSGLQAQDTA